MKLWLQLQQCINYNLGVTIHRCLQSGCSST